MTTTLSAASTATRNRLPAGRRDRRPALAALALLLVLGGALGSALVAFRSGDRVEVLMAAREIPVGARIEADDFRTVRVAANPDSVVLAAAVDNFVGSVARGNIPEGTLVNRNMFSGEDILPANSQLVGVVVDAARRPTERPETDRVVRLFYVSGSATQSSANLSPGDVVVEAAKVIEVGSGDSSDTLSITVLVSDEDAGLLADLASAGNVAVALLPLGTRPDVDTISR